MTERPILFQAPMVRAILDGRKTQTRRVVRMSMDNVPFYAKSWNHNGWAFYGEINGGHMSVQFICPIGKVGDRLWVRETWQTGMTEAGPQIAYAASEGEYFEINTWDGEDFGSGPSFNYEKCPKATWHSWLPDLVVGKDGRWRPSIHMPRWASRITLEITNIRVERLQDISDEDAIKEGIETDEYGSSPMLGGDPSKMWSHARYAFEELWNSMHKEPDPDHWWWNPWVWVIEFKRVCP